MGNYRNFKLVVYFVAHATAHVERERLEKDLAFFAKYLRLDKEYLEDENIFPPQEFLDKCGVFHYLGKEGDELLNTYWKKYKGN